MPSFNKIVYQKLTTKSNWQEGFQGGETDTMYLARKCSCLQLLRGSSDLFFVAGTWLAEPTTVGKTCLAELTFGSV